MNRFLIFFVVFQLLILTEPLKSVGSDDHSCRACCVSMSCVFACLLFCCDSSDDSIVQTYDLQQRPADNVLRYEVRGFQASIQRAEQCPKNDVPRDKDV